MCGVTCMEWNWMRVTMIGSRSRIHPQLTLLTLGGTVRKESADLVMLGWRLMLRWPLRSTFTLFPVLQLRGLASEESPGKYFMTGRSFWNLFGALSCRSWSIALQCGVRLPIRILNYWTESSGVLVFSWWCFGVQPYPSSICDSVLHAIKH